MGLARAAAGLAAFVTLVPSARADEAWGETRSAHFSVVSNAGPKTAESVALQFERVRAMFKKQWPWARVDAAEPTVIFAVKDEKTIRSLLPAYWQRKDGARPAGLSLVSPDRLTMILRTDVEDDENPFAILYHEYTHRLLALNFAWLPLWLNEGLAEFFGSSVIDGDDLTQGKPRPETIMLLRSSTLLPLETLFEVDQTSPHYNEETRATIFYAQSWALVHYLILADKQDRTARIDEFLRQLRRGVPESEARPALGDVKALERTLASYVRSLVFKYRKAKDFVGEIDRLVSTRRLSPAEVAAVRGDFLARTGQVVEARVLLDEAIKLDPSSSQPYETLALLSQSPDDARANVEKAVERTTTNFFTWYLAGLLFVKDGKLTAESEKAFRRSLELNPEFALAYSTLAALLASAEGRHDESARLALRVPELAPMNLLLQVGAAETLVKIDRIEEARAIAGLIESLSPAGPLKAAAQELLAGALPKDPAKRLAFHLKGCDEGKAADCTEAGERYAQGTGVARDYPRSVELFRKACDAKHALGCAWLGSQYERGHGTTKDEARAASLYRDACESDCAWACGRLGYLYVEGRGVLKDPVKSEPYLAKGCDGGDEWSCTKLAWFVRGGNGFAEDLPRAAKLYEKGCAGRNGNACAGLAWMFREGKGVAKDEARATELYRQACETGDDESCSTAGYRYEKGTGVAVDASVAASLYQKGCDGNDASSCTHLAFVYSFGRGVSTDPSRAVELFLKACEHGNARGCSAAGFAYQAGQGVDADPKKAVQYYEKACSSEEEPKCSGLGRVLLFGIGMPRDPARAVAILKKGCEGGDGESCAGLAYCYARGEGVPQDMAKAGELAKTACAAGHRRSCSPANLTPEMAKEEVAAAEKGCDDGLAAACGEAGVILVHQSSYDGAAGLFKRGCEGGDPASCAQLATAHLLGRGVTHDDARARELYRKACDAGEASACEALTLTK